MKKLNLNSFIPEVPDKEMNQYKVLSGLKEYQKQFNKNKLYPSLSELVYLVSKLEIILHKNRDLMLITPRRIKRDSVKSKNIVVEPLSEDKSNNNYQMDLIEWALPQIKQLIDEAYILYDFVNQSIEILDIGIPPEDIKTGYVFIPNNQKNITEIYRYETITYTSLDKPFHSLKTKYLETNNSVYSKEGAELLKLQLLKKYDDPPNIAASMCFTELDFPFIETIFPLAKRKMLDHITEDFTKKGQS